MKGQEDILDEVLDVLGPCRGAPTQESPANAWGNRAQEFAVRSGVAELRGPHAVGVMMHAMTAPTPDGGRMPVIAMVGQIVGSPTIVVGWLYHLFNSGVIGAIFGWLFGARVLSYGSGLGWGAAYGFAWWILGGLILMPVLLGMPAFAPLTMPGMQTVAMGSVVGHLVYGLTLGGLYVTLVHGARIAVA